MDQTQLLHLATALGVGLLIGAERERRKRQQDQPAAAGIRTFAVASVAGALGYVLGGAFLLGAVMAAVTVFAAVSAWRIGRKDPGVTTEVALVLTVLTGGLAMREPALAA
ncbi:MAG TPA: MgtC/SapB family protein, partial [Phenylobacterium sp.]|nr:MgtC/SapB family protein [Phenylobacterium sp.]